MPVSSEQVGFLPRLAGLEGAPFVGRKRELGLLQHMFRDVSSGRRRLVLLAGEPGIGKTRLGAEFAASCQAEGAAIIAGRCDEELPLPYMPFVEALRRYSETQVPDGEGWTANVGGDLAGLIPQTESHLSHLEPLLVNPEEARFRLFDAVDRALLKISSRSPLVCILEDLHWADKASLLLIRHLVRAPVAAPILFVGTYRDTDLVRTHPLTQMLGDFRRTPGFSCIRLRGLEPGDTSTLIGAWSGQEPPEAFVQAVYAETEGNPFFIQEIWRHLTESGVLVPENNSWLTPAAIERMTIPDGVRDVVDRRLSHLSADAGAVLPLAALFGRDFEAVPLELVAELPPDRLVASLDEAQAAGLICETGVPGAYQFSHALVQDVLCAEFSAPRRGRLHGRIAEALEASYGRRASENAGRLARHFLEAARTSPSYVRKAAHYSRLAAVQAESQAAWEDAIRHFEACLELATVSAEETGQDESDLLISLAILQARVSDFRSAWRCSMRAIEICRSRRDGVGLARAVLVAMHQASYEDQASMRREALEALGDCDPHLKARLLVGFVAGAWDWSEQAENEARQAAGIARENGYADVDAVLLDRNAHKLVARLRLEEAMPLTRAAWRAYDAVGDLVGAAHLVGDLGTFSGLAGDLAQSEACAAECLEYGQSRRLPATELEAWLRFASVALLRCDFVRFAALTHLIAKGVGQTSEQYCLLMARHAEMIGEPEQALATLASIDAESNAYGKSILPAARARIKMAAGDPNGARESLAEWAEAFEEETFDLAAAFALGEVDECLADLGETEMVGKVYERVRKWMSARSGMTSNLDRIRGALSLQLGRVDEAQDWYRRAMAWSERERCPVERGRCLEGLAKIAVRRHKRREALRLLEEAGALFRDHGAKLYLDRATAAREAIVAAVHGRLNPPRPLYPDGLSKREVEVLRLVVGGLSSREVSDRLVLSVRTVERHVANVYLKTGTHGRAQITSYALTRGLA